MLPRESGGLLRADSRNGEERTVFTPDGTRLSRDCEHGTGADALCHVFGM